MYSFQLLAADFIMFVPDQYLNFQKCARTSDLFLNFWTNLIEVYAVTVNFLFVSRCSFLNFLLYLRFLSLARPRGQRLGWTYFVMCSISEFLSAVVMVL